MAVLASLLPAVIVVPVFVLVLVRRGSARSPAGIVKRLISTPGLTHIVHVGTMQWAWDPTKPIGPGNHLYGPGVATYTLTDDGLVHVLWRATVGKPVDVRLTGPIPDRLHPQSPERRFVRKAVRLIVLTYVAFSGVGFGLGYALSAGSADARIAWGVFGVLLGWVLIAFVVQAVNVGRGDRSALRHPRPGPPAAD